MVMSEGAEVLVYFMAPQRQLPEKSGTWGEFVAIFLDREEGELRDTKLTKMIETRMEVRFYVDELANQTCGR
jgi:hypothetical protein